MDEFGLIARYLAPLAGEGAFGLTDDAALLGDHVVTKDVLVGGVHFRAEDPLDLVARKSLRANVSDLVAKGVRPKAYLLGVVWPAGTGEAEIAAFAAGLAEDQKTYGLALLGGDTTKAPDGAPMVISVTMIGERTEKAPVLRSGAKAGDALFVTGVLGAAFLGLSTLEAGGEPDEAEGYLLPNPPVDLTEAIAAYGAASLDVSDGLLADAGHMARASGVRINVELSALPLSSEGEIYVAEQGEEGALKLITFGDDYQTLMAVRPENEADLINAAKFRMVPLNKIGTVSAGEGVRLLRDDGSEVLVGKAGWSHF